MNSDTPQPPPPTSTSSPARTHASSTAENSSLAMTYSMDDSENLPIPLPPAYALTSTGNIPPNNNNLVGGTTTTGGRVSSFATTEDSIDTSADRSVDYTETEDSVVYYEGLQTQTTVQQRLADAAANKQGANNDNNLNQHYQYQESQEGYNYNDQSSHNTTNNNNLSSVDIDINDAALQGLGTSNNNNENTAYAANSNNVSSNSSNNNSNNDATLTIYAMHRKLLQLLSTPELFHEAIEWQIKLDKGIDPTLLLTPNDDVMNTNNTANNNTTNASSGFETIFDDDSTFRGLVDDDDTTTTATQDQSKAGDDDENESTTNKASTLQMTQNETFEFNPTNNDDKKKEKEDNNNNDNDNDNNNNNNNKKHSKPKKIEIPLPHQIFTPDAEVVLPQALTASQLFGIERITGIELEAAAGIHTLSQLFLRWLALMPEGDHMNVIDPPGLTLMKILGGGYRVTGCHRVVWRWMNKFSPSPVVPATTSNNNVTNDKKQDTTTDFDFGDLVTMTIIDVFETDSSGQLLSYCPTFDNRAVHKTPETIERLRKGATHLKERMEVVVNSPSGKIVNKVSNISLQFTVICW